MSISIGGGGGDDPKIDNEATSGLAGVKNSLAYRVHEIEAHFHSFEDWFGLANVPNEELHRASDVSLGTCQPFRIDAGNNDWGAWVQILGSNDTPNRAGKVYFDLHKIEIVGSENTNTKVFIQIAFGATAAAGLTALNYTTIPYLSPTNQAADRPISINMRRADAGAKVWDRTMAIGVNTNYLDFYIGLHEYIG